MMIRDLFFCSWSRQVSKTLFIVQLVLLRVMFIFPVAAAEVTADEQLPSTTFECLPWAVGQFVVYQINHFENEGGKNRYKISLVGKEMVNGKVYFWEKFDIFENRYFSKIGELFKKNITFLALVEPLTSEKFQESTAQCIQNGLFPDRAVKLKVQFFEGPFVDVDPSAYFSNQRLIEETLYSRCPDAMGKIDFSKMKFLGKNEKVAVPAGIFECGHIFVNTDLQKEYFDEGFDLWRSPKVPLLGIVKMEFSKTLYWEKWFYKHGAKKMNSVSDFIKYLLEKRMLGRNRADTYTIQLLDYGPRE